jgi:hypothetical protein
VDKLAEVGIPALFSDAKGHGGEVEDYSQVSPFIPLFFSNFQTVCCFIYSPPACITGAPG